MNSFYEMQQTMKKNVSYTGIILGPADQQKLLSQFRHLIPSTWEPLAHHMTINLGSASNGPAAAQLGEIAQLTVISVAQDDKVIAVSVVTNVPSINKKKHITLAVNRAGGGKPQHSNNLTNWQTVPPLELHGTIQEA